MNDDSCRIWVNNHFIVTFCDKKFCWAICERSIFINHLKPVKNHFGIWYSIV